MFIDILNRLRNPYVFLLSAITGSFCYLYHPAAGIFTASCALFIFFKPRAGAILVCLLLTSTFISSKTAFILNIKYDRKNPTLVTTKGYFTITDDPGRYAIGDLLYADFIPTVYSTYAPRLKYELQTPARIYRIPLLSGLLQKRYEHANLLLYRSGGRIVTTQAHIFAVRDYIPQKLQDEYVITGLAHLLAMSGFHVGIFVGAFLMLFSFIPLKPRVMLLFPFIFILIPLSGFAVTVIRAVAFCAVYFIAVAADLKVHNIKFISVLAGLIIIFSPFSLFSISFLLSFFAVYGILLISNKKLGMLKSIITIGIASTVFTLPLQLYFFGTANIVSVLTTALLTPFVWCQMILGLLSLLFTEIIIAPLSYLEEFLAIMMDYISKFSWWFIYVAKPPTWMLVSGFIAAFIVSCTRYKYGALLILIFPLLPIYNSGLIFPKLPPSPKGYILKTGEYSEIYYQGTHSAFVRHMVPAAAKMGIKKFDYGSIKIFDGTNLYIKINNESFSGKVCVNTDDGMCRFVYYTRSNSIQTPISEKIYVIYKNNVSADNIYQTSVGEVIFTENEIE